MDLQLDQAPVGSFQANCYVASTPNNRCLVFDPGAEGNKVQQLINGRDVLAILLTHGHSDHIGAVQEIKRATGAPVYLHANDIARATGVTVDHQLNDGDVLELDGVRVEAVLTPGHTDGEVCFLLPNNVAIVGDTIFEGGPGRTNSAADFRTTLDTLRIILQWPDDTVCYPGHGTSFRLGDIRSRVEAFVARDHDDNFYGDAEW
jgi:glyoxylase-like metal-dependent hydrolase (beta-lactamase superfamily II)